MLSTGTVVNPLTIQAGDEIATTTFQSTTDGKLYVKKSRAVKKVEFCPTAPESVHLDHECYDTRFATVIRKD